jgi:hypothetical protein
MRVSSFVALLVPAILAACTSALENPVTVFADPGKYEFHNCEQLAARERSRESEIPANADGGCNVLEGCAEPEIDPATATQYSNAMTGPARMSPHAFGRRTTFQSCKSSHS